MPENHYLAAITETRALKARLELLYEAREAGFFVPDDCIESLSSAIEDCASHPALALRVGR